MSALKTFGRELARDVATGVLLAVVTSGGAALADTVKKKHEARKAKKEAKKAEEDQILRDGGL